MSNALGLVEFIKVPTGMVVSDKMAKTSDIEIIYAATVCPGKYIVIFKGSLSSVNAALEVGKGYREDVVIDSFLLGNPAEDIYSAISGTSKIEEEGAIGIVESYSVASIIEAADIAAKTSKVSLIEIRLARGMCGKSFFIISGELSAVEMSVKGANKLLMEKGMYLDSGIIPNPDKNFLENLY